MEKSEIRKTSLKYQFSDILLDITWAKIAKRYFENRLRGYIINLTELTATEMKTSFRILKNCNLKTLFAIWRNAFVQQPTK